MLTFAEAERAAKVALDHARTNGASISVVVVDERGRDLYLARGDGAMWITPDIARAKAVTAGAFGMPSQNLAGMADQPWFASLLQNTTKLWAGGGGAPLLVEGKVAGGIGISGGSEELDRAAAEAGAQALQGAPV